MAQQQCLEPARRLGWSNAESQLFCTTSAILFKFNIIHLVVNIGSSMNIFPQSGKKLGLSYQPTGYGLVTQPTGSSHCIFDAIVIFLVKHYL